jgi:hypothetical protein
VKWLLDSRMRSLLAGAIGGLLGWLIAEFLLGAPHSVMGTMTYGLLAGLGIGLCLGGAEGILIGSRTMTRRGAMIGLIAGMIGGCIGAGFGQAGYSATTSSGSRDKQTGSASVFSAEMTRRLQEAGAKTGEVEIALSWQNQNDLDLHVIDPSGAQIFFQQRKSPSGGELDVDRNADCAFLTSTPVEHVVWPAGSAPLGQYKVQVWHYKNCGSGDPTPYTVETKVDGKIESFSGSIQFGDSPQTVTVFTREPPPPPPAPPGLGAAIARIMGWLIFGALVGCAEGLVRKSATALRNAAMGGAIGGAVGGLVFEIIARLLVPMGLSDAFCRGLGMVILGACIGLWIVILERAFAAVLAVRSGRFEGREIFLDRSEMRLGRNDALEIYLGFDPEIAPHHATISRDGENLVLQQVGGPLQVNGTALSRHVLHDGDAIQIGKTRMVFKRRGIAATTTTTGTGAAPVQAAKVPVPPPPPPVKTSAQTAPPQPPVSAPKPPVPVPSNAAVKTKAASDNRSIPPPPPPPPIRRP